MKKIIAVLTMLVLPITSWALEGQYYMSEFLEGKDTGKAYQSLITKENLPEWVKEGGVSTPANRLTINGEKYLALSGCQPHSCPWQSIAILYSLDKGNIYGVYSEIDMSNTQQTLKWLNVELMDSYKKSILFMRLNGMDVSN